LLPLVFNQDNALKGLIPITGVVEVQNQPNLIKMVLFQLPNRGTKDAWATTHCGLLLCSLENPNVLQLWFELVDIQCSASIQWVQTIQLHIQKGVQKLPLTFLQK
jgi:hypothetical protein